MGRPPDGQAHVDVVHWTKGVDQTAGKPIDHESRAGHVVRDSNVADCVDTTAAIGVLERWVEYRPRIPSGHDRGRAGSHDHSG